MVGLAAFVNPSAAGFGRIGGIQYSNDSLTRIEPLDHICDGGFCCGVSTTFTFLITSIEEIGGGVRCVISAIRANVEGFGWDREPCQISDHCRSCCVSQRSVSWGIAAEGIGDTFLGYEALPPCG